MRATVIVSLLILSAGCGSEPTRDLFSVEGVVRGQVTTAAGTPVSDASVALEGTYPLSNGNTLPLYDSTRTDAAGHYRATLAVMNLADTIAGFTIRVWPPVGSGRHPLRSAISDCGSPRNRHGTRWY